MGDLMTGYRLLMKYLGQNPESSHEEAEVTPWLQKLIIDAEDLMNDEPSLPGASPGLQENLIDSGVSTEQFEKNFQAIDSTTCANLPVSSPEIDEAKRTAAMFSSAIKDIEELRQNILGAADKDIARLALAISERIIGKSIASDPEILRRSVVEALESLQNVDQATIYVAPTDQEILQKQLESLNETEISLKIIADPSVEPGGVRIVTNVGEIDTSLRGQLNAIAEAMGLDSDQIGQAG